MRTSGDSWGKKSERLRRYRNVILLVVIKILFFQLLSQHLISYQLCSIWNYKTISHLFARGGWKATTLPLFPGIIKRHLESVVIVRKNLHYRLLAIEFGFLKKKVSTFKKTYLYSAKYTDWADVEDTDIDYITCRIP